MPRRKVIPEGTPITYEQFRVGVTFAEARAMLWNNSERHEDWKYKRRGTVLGYMRALKLAAWDEFCERNPELVRRDEGCACVAGEAPF